MNTTKNSQNIISDKTAKSISCVIPVYNDELTIEYIVNELIFTLENLKADYEIILINDGSPDRGGEIINKLALAHKNIKTIHHKVNLGYGQTLRDGFALATKKFIFITDGDGQYEMRDLNQAWFKVNERHAIIGYPRRRADGLKRIVVSKIYNTLCHLFLGSTVRSINCSFKIMPREFFLKNKLCSGGGFIDAEIVCRLTKSGYKLIEIPVNHCRRTFGSSTFLKVGNVLNIISEMLEFKKNINR